MGNKGGRFWTTFGLCFFLFRHYLKSFLHNPKKTQKKKKKSFFRSSGY